MGFWDEDAFSEEPYISDAGDDIWEDREFNETPIAELDTDHLRNIVRGLEAGNDYWGQEDKLSRLKTELNHREIQNND